MKGGVMLNDFYDAETYQPDLFSDTTVKANSEPLMRVLDKLITVERQDLGIAKVWSMKRGIYRLRTRQTGMNYPR